MLSLAPQSVRKFTRAIGGVVALALCVALPAHAVVILNTYVGGGAGIGGWAFGGAMAVKFTPAQNIYFTDASFYVMSGGEGAASQFEAYLMNDAADQPGTVLESLGKLPVQSSFTPKLEQILSKNNPLLAANTPYWLLLKLDQNASQAAGGWAGGSNIYVRVAATQTNGTAGPWTSLQNNNPQFIVNGSINAPSCLLDLDGNGQVDALTDGLMILRAMFGLTGTAVTTNAIGGGNPQRPTWAQIEPFLFLSKMDIDGNGKIDALTDGLLILRAMFGLKGPAVTTNALGTNPSRTSWDDVRGYLNATCGTAYTQ